MNDTAKTVWQVLDSRQMGGIESHVLELSLALRTQGWQVLVLFLEDYGPHPLKNKLDDKGLFYRCLNGKIGRFAQMLRQHRPAILHTHGYKAGILGRLIARSRQIPVVSTFHAGEAVTGKLAFYSFLDRVTAKLCQPIAVNAQIAKKLPRKTRCLNNFVAIPEKKKTTSQGIIGFVGRLSSEKGPDLFCKLAKNHPDLTFRLYGDGPLRPMLEKRYGDFVQFAGHVDMAHHWQEIDLLCMPSRYEGLPMAALEAMAHGIPVLASQAGALAKLIDHGQNGWVFALKQMNKFSETVKHWHSLDPRIKKIMTQNARQKIISEYSAQIIVPEVEKIYHRAAGTIK